jgi:putative oxidoreductase
MVILGLWTRLATIPLLAVIATAIVTTRIPMLHQQGVWAMLHEARVDCSMVLGLVFLLIAGGGAFALTRSQGRRIDSGEKPEKRRPSFEEFQPGSRGAGD